MALGINATKTVAEASAGNDLYAISRINRIDASYDVDYYSYTNPHNRGVI